MDGVNGQVKSQVSEAPWVLNSSECYHMALHNSVNMSLYENVTILHVYD